MAFYEGVGRPSASVEPPCPKAPLSEGAEPRLVIEEGPDEACRIDDAERLAPFLMSIVSPTDHFLFASSAGGLAAGRVDASRSLFPYETEDKLHRSHGVSGPITLVRAHLAGGGVTLWEPFDDRQIGKGQRRTIRKSVLGAWFEVQETDSALGLSVSVRWDTSEQFGFVRTTTLTRTASSAVVSVEVLDGLLDLLPDGVPLELQQKASCLADAYKRTELDPATRLAICSLEARMSDRPAPEESLRANVVWSTGAEGLSVSICEAEVRAFREGRATPPKNLVTGDRGAYLVRGRLDLRERLTAAWRIVGDVHLGQIEVEALSSRLRDETLLDAAIDADIALGAEGLRRIVALCDGLVRTGDRVADVHHMANVLFNEMRGGVLEEGNQVPSFDLAAFIARQNRGVHEKHADFLSNLGDLPHIEVVAQAERTGDMQLVRLCYEHLPLSFSRKHGDPSRPWNHFSIRTKGENGRRRLSYQGNWRDIFQNWEALCQSYPAFLDSVIAKFVNASTIDGYNPYRVTSEGIDWEVPDPADPWGNIGYWGDHQVAYLSRLLESAERARPGMVTALLGRDCFSYADVPYRIKPYADLVRDAKDTIVYDRLAAARVSERTDRVGFDGRLVFGEDGEVLLVNLAEKLLIPALSKLSGLVVDGGIWLNTQRPEWNDANNALVGAGLSVVTLAHLRRYLALLGGLFAGEAPYAISREVARWLERVHATLSAHAGCLRAPQVSQVAARTVLDELGAAFSDYRAQVYEEGMSGRVEVSSAALRGLLDVALEYVDHGLRANARPDGLYHSYNLLKLDPGAAVVEPLYEMLEGQVAVLSSGLLSAKQSLDLLSALFASAMYRADQDSFMLYPERRLPSFLEKNRLPSSLAAENPLLEAMLAAGDGSLVARDERGNVRFHPDLTGASALASALDKLAQSPHYGALVASHGPSVLALFESVFHHHAFTGRSGTMHKYEGVGCIYWHMVAKLLVATQEVLWQAVDEGAPRATIDSLEAAYTKVREGLLSRKSPAVSGVFSTDPYSHTPLQKGAQQPGMTGTVKEEILTRLGELGVRIQAGKVTFAPTLLRASELLDAPSQHHTYDDRGRALVIDVPKGALCFSLCQVPVLLQATDGPFLVTVSRRDGRVAKHNEAELDPETSASIFEGRGEVAQVLVEVPRELFANEPTANAAA